MTQKQFKILNDQWYKKLKNEGFEDIEESETRLHKWSPPLTRFNAEIFESKQVYYQLAGQFLHEHIFESNLHKKVWELHSEGIEGREIAKSVKQIKKTKVYSIINILKAEMIKKYIGASSE